MVTLIVAVLFAASLSLLPGPSSDVPPEILPAPVHAGISYTTHGNISINGNAQFNNTNFPNNGVVSGNGSASNPYIIEGWDISSASAHGIWIQNTNVYFIIRDCYIHDGGASYHGIFLQTCINGILSDNNCSNNNFGIRARWSSGNNVTNNNCSNNRIGIFIGETSHSNTLINNTCSSNLVNGMHLFGSNSNTLINNTCNSNSNNGITLEAGASSNTICNNTFNLNNQRGMNFWSGSNNIVSWNEVRNNTQDGVRINSVFNNNRIWNNTFIGNNGAGSVYDPAHIQAYDGGTNNRWNSSGTPHGYGNNWSDWPGPDLNSDGIVDIPYALGGSAGSLDYYPLAEYVGTPIPEFSEMIVPIVGLIMIAFIFGRARKKP